MSDVTTYIISHTKNEDEDGGGGRTNNNSPKSNHNRPSSSSSNFQLPTLHGIQPIISVTPRGVYDKYYIYLSLSPSARTYPV